MMITTHEGHTCTQLIRVRYPHQDSLRSPTGEPLYTWALIDEYDHIQPYAVTMTLDEAQQFCIYNDLEFITERWYDRP